MKFVVSVTTEVPCERKIEVRASNVERAIEKAIAMAKDEANFLDAWDWTFPDFYEGSARDTDGCMTYRRSI